MSDTLRRGRFISLEGVDGAGKSTHLQWLVDTLREQGKPVRLTREPGGTPLGETLRGLLLHESMSMDTEAMLMFASRQQHLDEVVRPALAAGEWVVCDRFTDASYAYQCGGRGLPWDRVAALEAWVHADLQPDLTLLFDLPPAVSMARLASARTPDRFEQQDEAFFARVRAAYLRRATGHAARFRVINAEQPVDMVRAEVAHVLEERLAFWQAEVAR